MSARGGARLRTEVQCRLLCRLQSRAHQPRRQGTYGGEDQENHLRLHSRSGQPGGQRVCLSAAERHPQGFEHQGGRGRQGHREQPARHQHRFRQRAVEDFQPDGHRHPGCAGSRRYEMELHQDEPRSGGRTLHLGRPLLSGPVRPTPRLQPRNHPGRPPHERRHGCLCGRPDREADAEERHPGAPLEDYHHGVHLQGELSRCA